MRYAEGECPNCEAALNEMLTVPLHENWTDSELQNIAEVLHKVSRNIDQLRS